jgi:hypothetical protein
VASISENAGAPFDLTRHGKKKLITNQSVKELKPDLEGWEEGLSEACGCYVFGPRAGLGYTPYYVGQACKSSMINESLNASNREKYNKALGERRGTPVLFLLPMRTPQGKLRKKPKAGAGIAALDFLESWLIAQAIEKNISLINNKRTYFLRNIHVVGFFNPTKGESTKASQALTKALY